MTEQELINKIRSDYSREKNTQRTLEGYASSIKTLADDLNSEKAHFIFELIQNAEDNDYADGITPTLRFRVNEIEIEGKRQIALIVENNETGFQEKHVDAICKVGHSTKSKSQGYIGEKGIGFKSVFRITSCPYIFSNGFHFSLPEKDEETDLGHIVPKWVDNIPAGIEQDWTNIVLPINEKNTSVKQVIKALMDIAPETILFLKKLKTIKIEVSTPEANYEIDIEKDDTKAPLIELTYLKEEDHQENVISSIYWMATEPFEKPKEINHEKRKGINSRDVSVAILLDNEVHSEELFAYLPVWNSTGLPFLVNADFILVGSRENIHIDEDWNKWLRDNIAEVYKKAFLTCLQSNDLSKKQKSSIYASIPLETHKKFLEPVIERIQVLLRNSSCIQTSPDYETVIPGKSRRAKKKFRELLNAGLSCHEYSKDSIRLVHADIAAHSKQLKAIGVQPLLPDEIAEWLKKVELHNQSIKWFVQLYRYLLSEHKFVESSLTYLPIIPIDTNDSQELNLSCDTKQPIYFACDEDTRKKVDSIPDWLSKLVPVAFLTPELFELLDQQEDADDLKKWMTYALNIYSFSMENYCVDILTKLKNEYEELKTQQLIEATEFLTQNVGDDFSWDSLPVILADDRRMPFKDAKNLTWNNGDSEENHPKIQAVVVPENYDPETGWQNIWQTEDDRKHFVALERKYNRKTIKKFLEATDIDIYPPPLFLKDGLGDLNKYEKSCIYECPYSKYEKSISNYRPPSCCEGEKNILGITAMSLVEWMKENNLSQYNKAIVEYFYYKKKEKYYNSELLYCLRTVSWLPTTKGHVRPSRAFLPKKSIKEILGDNVPYFEQDLPENISTLLGIRSDLTVEEMLGLLQDYSGDSSANLDLIQRLYSEIETRFFYDGKSVKPAFLNHALIFIPSDEKNGTWHKPDECVWQDFSDVLGDDFVYLEKHYPKLRELFVEILEVKEKVDTECFSRRWLKLQDNPISDKKEQRRLIEHLYRVLKPIAQMAEDKRPDWWDDFVNQAKFYTQLDTFEDREEVVVPDDGELKSIFKDCDIPFSWRPAKDSFNDWLYFYKAFGISMLSESVTMELVDEVDYDNNDQNEYITEDSVKMIAAWLREKQQEKYIRLLNDGVFKQLLMIKEANTQELIAVNFTLKIDTLEKDVEAQYPVFWDRGTDRNILVLSSNANKSDIANHIAQIILNSRNYKDLADWTELVLGSRDTNRLNKRGWNVPQEIVDIFKTKESMPKEETVEESEPLEPSIPQEGSDEIENSTSTITSSVTSGNYSESSDNQETAKTLINNIINKPTFDKPEKQTQTDDSSSKPETEPAKINLKDEMKQAFNKPGETELKERFSDDDGDVKNPERRREKSYDEHRERQQQEPSADARRKKTLRTILEGPDKQIREYLYQRYKGKCQICQKTFPEKNGKPFFIANYIVERKVARAVDASANALCLCAEHFAKWQHGAIETEHIIKQIDSYKTKSEGGLDRPILRIKLCGEECLIIYEEKHFLELQEFLRASDKQE
jgi:hypothetical protein